MFEVLDETQEHDDLVAIRVGWGTRRGYDELYSLLIDTTETYGAVRVYEEVPNWTLSTFLTHCRGIIPDLRDGPDFTIERYAAVGNTGWSKLLFDWWRIIRPIWPVAPEQMRYFDMENRSEALRWV